MDIDISEGDEAAHRRLLNLGFQGMRAEVNRNSDCNRYKLAIISC